MIWQSLNNFKNIAVMSGSRVFLVWSHFGILLSFQNKAVIITPQHS